jgi:hypothetical protein
MRIATLAALVMAGIVTILAMALWPEPRFDVVAPDAAIGATSVTPGAAVAATDRAQSPARRCDSRSPRAWWSQKLDPGPLRQESRPG